MSEEKINYQSDCCHAWIKAECSKCGKPCNLEASEEITEEQKIIEESIKECEEWDEQRNKRT